MANYPGTKLVGVAYKFGDEKFTVVRSRSPQNLKCGHFTLFCRGRQRNVPKCKTQVQSDCFCSLLFCGVVVAATLSLTLSCELQTQLLSNAVASSNESKRYFKFSDTVVDYTSELL